MSTLYEIDKAIMDWEMEIDPETGEILNYEELDNLQMAREQKIENIGLYFKNISAEAEMVKAEAKNLTERYKRLENKAESLKKYLAYALQGEKFSTPRLAVSYRKSESVEIGQDFVYDKKWCEVSTTYKPDKKKIKDAIKSGKEVAGAKLIEKQNINVK